MRIVRVLSSTGPSFGLVRDEAGEDVIDLLDGDPITGDAKPTGESIPFDSVTLLAPVVPSKIIGIGDNYLADGEDRGEFTDPLLFFKPSTSVCGPGDPILRPRNAGKLAFEGELAVVMKYAPRGIQPNEVEHYILGYTIANDVSAKGWQANDTQWTRAKGSDTFCPLGPWLDTDMTLEVASNLKLETTVSGKLLQSSNTSRLKRSIEDTIAALSQSITFLSGDTILTGTPAGAGPMDDGDIIEVTIEHLGTLRNETTPMN